MGIAIKKLFCELLFLMFQFLDSLTAMFKILCGTEVLDVNGEQVTLIDLFLDSSPIISAFLSIFLISGIVIMISMIVAVLKKTIKEDEKRSHGKIVFQGLWAIITSLVMAVVMFGGIFFSNAVLQLVDKATMFGDHDTTIAQQIFQMCLNDVAYEEKIVYQTKRVYDPETAEWREEEVCDSDGNKIIDRIEYVPIEGGSFQVKPDGGYYTIEDIRFSATSDVPSTSVNDVFGVRKKTAGLFEDESKDFEEGKKPMVRLADFNIFLGYLSVIMLLVALVGSMLGLVKRVYDLVILFLLLPLVSGVIPLDDGARFKSWQSSVVSKVILAYGAVLSVNVYLLILPIIMNLKISGISNFGNGVFRLFLLIGGALCINGGQLLMARVFGTSAEESREMAQSARALAAGAATAIHMPGKVANLALGQRVADGQGNLVRAGGLFGRGGFVRTAGKALGGATNLAGNVLGGQAYRRPASAISGVAGKATNAVKQGFHGLTHLNRQSGGAGQKAGAAASPMGGGGSNVPSASANTSGTEIAANAGLSQSGGGSQGASTANVNAPVTPNHGRTNPFKNGVVGAALGTVAAVGKNVRNTVQSKRNHGLLTPLSKNISPYSRPKANFTPKAKAESNNRRGNNAQKGNAPSVQNKPSNGNNGVQSALSAANNKSASSEGNKGQFMKRKK